MGKSRKKNAKNSSPFRFRLFQLATQRLHGVSVCSLLKVIDRSIVTTEIELNYSRMIHTIWT